MFILFGTKTVKTPQRQGLNFMRNCDRCHYLSRMQEFKSREYFTLFFIPIFPISKGESLLICNRCGAKFYPQAEDYLRSNEEMCDSDQNNKRDGSSQEEKMVIKCEYCKGSLRVPVMIGRNLAITCPHCREKFDFKVDENTI